MTQQRIVSQPCPTTGRPIPVRQWFQWVSGISDDQLQPGIDTEHCLVASKCPHAAQCPLVPALPD